MTTATKPWPMHVRIVLALIVGGVIGLTLNILSESSPIVKNLTAWLTAFAEPVGQVFLRLVLMVVLPLIFSALALGVAGLRDARKVGRLGLRTLGLTALLSFSAVIIGIFLVNAIQPGKWLSEDQRTQLEAKYSAGAEKAMKQAQAAKSVKDTLLDIIPRNPLQEMVGALDGSSPGGGIMAVMFFSLMFGIALTHLSPEQADPMIHWLEALQQVSMTIIGWALNLAPIAVACLVGSVLAHMGLSILAPLMGFVLTVMLGLSVQMFVVYPLVLWGIGRRSPWRFFVDAKEALLTAFGTSSSNATLPTAMRVAHDELKIPRETANFVLTIGATGNQNGTALYEGIVVLFLAQVFHKDLSLMQQVQVVLMSVLAGVGTAGVPGGSLPLIVVVLNSVGVPGEGIGLILGIDRVLDMCRTTLNVAGDLTIAATLSHAEQTADQPIHPAPPTA